MIKNYKFTLNEDERKRILSLHKERTKNQYLVSEQGVIPDIPKNSILKQKVDFSTVNTEKPIKYDSSSEYPLGEIPSTFPLKQPVTLPLKQSPSSSQTITFNQGDLTGKQTVMAKLKELGLETTNLKKTFETVINTTYGGLQKKI